MKIVAVTPIPTPYRDPLWCELGGRAGVDLRVLYCAERKSDRPWTLAWTRPPGSEVLPSINLTRWRGAGNSCYWNPAIRSRIARLKPDALLVGGYNHPTMLWAMRYAQQNTIPYYLMSESHLLARRSRFRQTMKNRLVRRVIRQAAGGLPTGRLAAQYLIHYGAQPEKLCAVPNAPDVDWHHAQSKKLRPQRDEFRRSQGLSDAPMALFAGRLLGFKGVETLLRAFALVSRNCRSQLVVIGDGPEAGRLERLCDELGIRPQVHFAGFVQPAMMPTWYAAADVFVLPSSETWGVVVLEALASGLQVVISDEVGCHADVLNDARVGETVPARNVEKLADALVRRLENAVDAEDVANAWRPVHEQMKYSAIAERLVDYLGRGQKTGLHGQARIIAAGDSRA